MKHMLNRINSIFAVFLAFILALLMGVVALRNPWRVDLSARNTYVLSAKSRELLEQLDRDVKITVVFEEKHSLFDHIDKPARAV